MDVEFFDTAGAEAGGVTINFNADIEYKIGYCSTVVTPFTAALPAETKKTWTITYNYTKLVLHCNGVQVLNVVLSECVDSRWEDVWGSKPTQIEFGMMDDASDTYCFSSNPGKYNGVIDSGE